MSTQKPKIFRQYLSGLAAYSYFRALDAVETVVTAPVRLVQAIKARLEAKLSRRKRRGLTLVAAIIVVVALVAVFSLYAEPLRHVAQVALARSRALVTALGQRLRALRRPVVVVVPQQARTVINEKVPMSS